MDDKTKFIEKIYDKKQLKEIETKLKCLGNDTKYNVVSFCLSRLIITATSFILTILLTDMGYIYAPFVAIACYYLFYYLNITKKTKIRNRRLEHQALYFFEIFAKASVLIILYTSLYTDINSSSGSLAIFLSN